MKRDQIDHEGLKDHVVVLACCCNDLHHPQREAKCVCLSLSTLCLTVKSGFRLLV